MLGVSLLPLPAKLGWETMTDSTRNGSVGKLEVDRWISFEKTKKQPKMTRLDALAYPSVSQAVIAPLERLRVLTEGPEASAKAATLIGR